MAHSLAIPPLELHAGLRSQSVSGRPLRVRYARRADVAWIAEMLQQISAASLELRYLAPKPLSAEGAFTEATRMLAQTDRAGAVLLVTTLTPAGEILVGVGELAINPLAATRAEFALVIRDDYQADGIGTLLMRALVATAEQAGVVTLSADLALWNMPMRRLIHKLGLPYRLMMGHGSWTLALDLA